RLGEASERREEQQAERDDRHAGSLRRPSWERSTAHEALQRPVFARPLPLESVEVKEMFDELIMLDRWRHRLKVRSVRRVASWSFMAAHNFQHAVAISERSAAC